MTPAERRALLALIADHRAALNVLDQDIRAKRLSPYEQSKVIQQMPVLTRNVWELCS